MEKKSNREKAQEVLMRHTIYGPPDTTDAGEQTAAIVYAILALADAVEKQTATIQALIDRLRFQ